DHRRCRRNRDSLGGAIRRYGHGDSVPAAMTTKPASCHGILAAADRPRSPRPVRASGGRRLAPGGVLLMAWDFQALFRKHAQELDRFLRRRGHNVETAADLTQDTFLRMMTATPQGQANNPRAYLY